MIITEIIWQIVMFFIPGVISFVVFRHVAGYAINAIYKLVIYAVIFGLIDYTLYEWFIGHILYEFEFGTYLAFWKILSYQYIKIDTFLMLTISVFSFFSGAIIGYVVLAIRKVYRPSLHVKLWDNILNSNELKEKKVIITDYENDCRYIGMVKSFSYFSHYREIVLTEARKEVIGKGGIVMNVVNQDHYDFYLHLKENKFDIAWDTKGNTSSVKGDFEKQGEK